MKSKEQWREELQDAPPVAGLGKIAEAVRRIEAYRQCRQIFIAPAPALAQLRINALLDGKELIVPGPGLKEGFYLLRPFSIPFPKLALAVSLKGIPVHGELLRHEALASLTIGVLITEALAVDARGVRLGDGTGFFDLACAILHRCGALTEAPAIWAAAVPRQPDELPAEPWDVRMHALIGPQGIVQFPERDPLPAIAWQHIPKQRIKKITPLWKEWEREGGEGS